MLGIGRGEWNEAREPESLIFFWEIAEILKFFGQKFKNEANFDFSQKFGNISKILNNLLS